MQLARGRGEGEPSELRTSTFTGTVCVDPVLSAPGVAVNSVLFLPGARTYWHVHPGGQLLLVTSGRGFVVTRERTVAVQSGDTVWTEPGEEHWHGGGVDTCLVHVAVSHLTTEWHDEVTDAEVQAALART